MRGAPPRDKTMRGAPLTEADLKEALILAVDIMVWPKQETFRTIEPVAAPVRGQTPS